MNRFLPNNIFFLSRYRPAIKWFLDGMEISEKRTEFKQFDDGETYKLSLTNVTTDMHGKYSCVIKNDYGKIEDECQVTVNCMCKFNCQLIRHFKLNMCFFFACIGQPKIRKELKDIEVTENDTLLLEVEVYAVPEPKIVWFKDGQEVRSDARIKIQRDSQRLETYNLTLNLIKREEAGVYEMKASNTLGTAVCKSVVTVNSK